MRTVDRRGKEWEYREKQNLREVIERLSPSAANQVLVGTDADQAAWQSGGTLRTSIGLGTGDSPQFTAVTVDDEAYDESGWDSDLTVPTKNAVRDKFESLADVGAWDFIGSVTAAASTIDFTDIDATYATYMFVLQDINLSADGELEILTDSDNGASYDTGASDYGWATNVTTAANNPFSDAADTEIQLVGTTIGGASNELINGVVFLYNPAGTSHTGFTWQLQLKNASGELTVVVGAGARLSAAAVNAVRFQSTSLNITDGTIRLYGLVPS